MEQTDFIMEPPLTFLDDHIMDIEFHPISDIIVATLVTGSVKMY